MSKKISWNFPVMMIVFLLLVQGAFAHGSMKDPISRIYACYLENPETPDSLACRDAIAAGGTQPLYDWNEVNQREAGGDHQAVIPDGQLASGGREKYAAFDEPREDWALTFLPSSGTYMFQYEAYVPHNEGYFELYVTNDQYDFSEPLKWSDLEYPPFATIVEPPVIDGAYQMQVPVSEGKSGRHVIYVIWQRTDSPEAFYSASDVWFGNAPTPVPTPPPACQWPAWNSTTVYAENDMVTYNSISWRAKWSNSGTEPSTAGTGNPWEFGGECDPGGSTTATPGITPTPGPTTTLNQGDVNADGQVTILDALLTAQFFIGVNPPDFHQEVADVNCSGAVDIVDALMIAQYYVNLLAAFPC